MCNALMCVCVYVCVCMHDVFVCVCRRQLLQSMQHLMGAAACWPSLVQCAHLVSPCAQDKGLTHPWAASDAAAQVQCVHTHRAIPAACHLQ